MEKKHAPSDGIRVEIGQGTNEAVALDALVDDLLHGRTHEALKDLHEPHLEDEGNSVTPE